MASSHPSHVQAITEESRTILSGQAEGMTQQSLADSVGVTRQTIVAMETGTYTPSLALAIRIARSSDARSRTFLNAMNDQQCLSFVENERICWPSANVATAAQFIACSSTKKRNSGRYESSQRDASRLGNTHDTQIVEVARVGSGNAVDAESNLEKRCRGRIGDLLLSQ